MDKKIDEVILTSYALGELPENQMKEIAMEVQKNPELEKEVKEIQNLTKSIAGQLKVEDKPRLNAEQREKFMSEKPSGFKFKWRHLYLAGGSLATVFVMFTVLTPHFENFQNKTDVSYSTEVDKALVDPIIPPSNSAPKVSFAKKRVQSKKMMAQRARPMGGMVAEMAVQEDMIAPMPMPSLPSGPAKEFNTESYNKVTQNNWIEVLTQPLSTFSIDVDTASYTNTRRFLMQGRLPVEASVRVEEFINYFDYSYEAPSLNSKHPFNVHTEVASSPWHQDYKIVRIGLKGAEMKFDARPTSNLVFLLDTSGSMNQANKLPLLKQAMKLLVTKLTSKDRVSIVTYAGSSGVVLPSTSGNEKAKIIRAIDSLQPGGGTNGQAGIQLAYNLAQQGFVKGGVNRVILATDGDFNLGTTNHDALIDLIKKKSQSKTFLTILGMGTGNYKDHQMESIANKGNGNYYYLDTFNEARKVLVNDINGTLVTIAKDVKIQVEFNPALVDSYRLIGYENRKLAAKDFNDDKKDAGEIGAGHKVTAIYEIVPKGVKFHGAKVDELKYQKPKATTDKSFSDELLTVKLRYKKPEASKSVLVKVPVKNSDKKFSSASMDTKLAVSAASFAMILRGDSDIGDMNISKVKEYSSQAAKNDQFGYRQEFVELVDLAKQIKDEGKAWK